MTGRAPTIRVDRRWFGATPGTLVNPTVWLAVAAVILGAAGSIALALGWWPPIATVLTNTLALYFAFTVLHESTHGIAHAHPGVNRWLGRIFSFSLTIPAEVFDGVHYEHHRHTNDPERDPDLFITHGSPLRIPARSLRVFFEYRRDYYGQRLWRSKAELRQALCTEGLIVSALVGAALLGHVSTLVFAWAIPVLFAGLFLGVTFNYLPHYPFDTTERYQNTRVYPGRLANAILLGQNYHLVHHLWVTIPWHCYRRVFDALESDLERRGARIGWRAMPAIRRAEQALGAQADVPPPLAAAAAAGAAHAGAGPVSFQTSERDPAA